MNNFQEISMNKDDEPEESTWTFYFEELLWKNDQEMITSSCNKTQNSFVPDDASSFIVKKTTCFQEDHAKKLSYKKMKTNKVMIDDSLEDTASSPIRSLKVAYFDRVKIKKKNKKILHISEDKVDTCEANNKRMVNSNMELKKRGLCLVPLSSLANYLS